MGGHAITKVPVRRYARDEYFEIADAVLSDLRHAGVDAAVIPAYHAKETFGDCDILVCCNNFNFEQWVKDTYNPVQIVHNGDCVSFPYEELQVDLIKTSEACKDAALAYFSYNDLGNFMGRVAHKFGTKYGHKGLLLPVRYGTHLLEDVVLSQEPSVIFSFLGYDYERFLAGFDTLEDVFAYAASTPYFCCESYNDDQLNHTNRTRNRKRASFMLFREWLAMKDVQSRFVPEEDKNKYLPFIEEHFPGSTLHMDALLSRAERYKNARARVLTVARALGLVDREVGEAMSNFKAAHGKGDGGEYSTAVESMSDEEIEQQLKFNAR